MNFWLKLLSLPSWERGLKRVYDVIPGQVHIVVPLVGTWIETKSQLIRIGRRKVVPLVGTWIETAQISLTNYQKGRRSPRGNVD